MAALARVWAGPISSAFLPLKKTALMQENTKKPFKIIGLRTGDGLIGTVFPATGCQDIPASNTSLFNSFNSGPIGWGLGFSQQGKNNGPEIIVGRGPVLPGIQGAVAGHGTQDLNSVLLINN